MIRGDIHILPILQALLMHTMEVCIILVLRHKEAKCGCGSWHTFGVQARFGDELLLEIRPAETNFFPIEVVRPAIPFLLKRATQYHNDQGGGFLQGKVYHTLAHLVQSEVSIVVPGPCDTLRRTEVVIDARYAIQLASTLHGGLLLGFILLSPRSHIPRESLARVRRLRSGYRAGALLRRGVHTRKIPPARTDADLPILVLHWVAGHLSAIRGE